MIIIIFYGCRVHNKWIGLIKGVALHMALGCMRIGTRILIGNVFSERFL